MPGEICAVSSCKSNRIISKKKGITISFHSFPKGTDSVTSTIRDEWIKRCTRKDKFNLKTSKICSLHFKPTDFERDLKNELLGLRLRRILKKNVIPTLNLNGDFEELSEKSIENISNGIAGKRKTNTSFSNPEWSRLLDVSNTGTAVPSPYLEVLNTRNTVSILKRNILPTLDSNDECDELLENSVEDTFDESNNLVESSQTDTSLSYSITSQLLSGPSTSTPQTEVLDSGNTLSILKRNVVSSLDLNDKCEELLQESIDTSLKIAGRKKTKNLKESSQTGTSLRDQNIYKKKYENLLRKYHQLKCTSYNKIKLLNSMRKYYKMKYRQSINKITKSVMAETALKYDAYHVLELLLTLKKEKS